MTFRYSIIIILFIMTLPSMAQDIVANQILAQVNQSRSEAPLVFNTQLQQAAQQHSNDMASVDQLSHTGTGGSQFWERIQANGYVLIVGAENILSRSDTDAAGAFAQWFNSDPHRNNMLNRDYTEVGIAFARSQSGRVYFTMVLASRADFVRPDPTIVPTSTSVPPTPTPLPVPIITSSPSPIPTLAPTIAPLVITATPSTIPFVIVTNTSSAVPTEIISPDIRLTYDANSFLLQNISGRVLNLSSLIFESETGVMGAFRWNTRFLSQPLSGFTNNDCLQAWTLAVDFLPNPTECRYRHAWIAVSNDAVFWAGTDFFTVRNGDTLVGICRVADGVCDVNLSTSVSELAVIDPVQFGGLPDLRLEYPDSSFSLINVSGRPLDLTGLVFRSDSGELAIDLWDNGFLTQPLNNFEANGCLQAWTPDYPDQPQSNRCELRHAWVLVNDAQDFWRQTTSFTVERDGILIGRCDLTTTVCSLSLSSNLGDVPAPATTATIPTALPQPTAIQALVTSAPNPASTSDVQLILTDQSVTLRNTSGRALNVSALAFASSSGTFPASRWAIPELTVPLSQLPTGDCLQVWAVGAIEQSKPDSCAVRHGWVAAFAYEQFWTSPNVFDVYYSGQVIASCDARASTCNFDLP